MRKITLGCLNINDAGKKYVNDALDNNRLSAGKYTTRFENEFAALHQCAHGVFCNSGTSALQIALAALKEYFHYTDGDEVLVPATTFIATSNVVLQNGLKPVFVDVDSATFNIDVNKIKEKLTSRTRCILPVHLFGLPADSSIFYLAHTWGLQVLEDSCETAFAKVHGQSVGNLGDIACFSTYVAHLIVGGVGGLVTTNDPELVEICRSLMAHGRDSIYTNIDQDDAASDDLLKQMISRRYSFDRVGYSYRCTELEAAIACSELEHWERNITIRRTNAAYLTKMLRDLKEYLQLPVVPAGYEHSFMLYPMVLASFIDRDKFLLHLEQRGIETRYMFPLLTQPVYRKLFPDLAEKYPVSLNLSRQGFFVGMHQGLTLEDMDYLSNTIHEYFGA